MAAVSGHLKVTPMLADAGPTMKAKAVVLEEQLLALRARVLALQDTWKGVAANDYSTYQAQWDAASDGLFGPNGILVNIGLALTIVNENHFEGESANGQSWAH